MATYDADYTDALSFGEDETGHESHAYTDDAFSFSDSYNVNEHHVTLSDSFNFNEALIGESAGTHSFNNQITFVESWRRTIDVSRRSDTIAFFDFPFADPSGNDAEVSQSLAFTDLYSATKTIAPDRRILSESIAFVESRTVEKVRVQSESIHFLEDWCILGDIQRSRADVLLLSESRRRYVNDQNDPRNNPITIPSGTGFSMKGNYRKRRSETIHFEDRFTPVDADGVPLVLEACHYNEFHHVGWGGLSGWSGLVSWDDLGE